MAGSERGSWLQRNWLWLLPVGCGGALVLLLGATALVVVGAFAGLKSTWPYTEAIRLARENPAVVEALGEPIRPGWLVGGTIRFQDDSAEAELAIPIRGPANSGTIHILATKHAGRWSFEVAVVEIRGREQPIDLLEGLDRLRVGPSSGPPLGRPVDAGGNTTKTQPGRGEAHGTGRPGSTNRLSRIHGA